MEILWDESYSVGNSEIDAQHKELFQLFNDLLNSLSENKEPDDTSQYVARLGAYTVYHFNSEEIIMKENNYPNLEKHLEQHEYFKQQFSKFVDRYKKDGKLIENDLLLAIRDWLVHHVTSNSPVGDQAFGIYMMIRNAANASVGAVED